MYGIFLAVCLFADSECSFSQITIAPEVGFNDPYWSGSFMVGAKWGYIFGVNAGGIVHLDFTKSIFIETGVSFKVTKFGLSDQLEVTTNSLLMPLLFNVKLGPQDDNERAFYIGAGAYIERMSGGAVRQKGAKTSLKVGDTPFGPSGNGDNLRQYDYGICLDAGVIQPSGIYFKVTGYVSTADYTLSTTLGSGSLNFYWGLSAGYLIGYKRARTERASDFVSRAPKRVKQWHIK